jgi:tetratricopeptide (TPR) repeat protein
MNDPHDPQRTVDAPSSPADSLEAGLAAGFGPPRSSPGDLRPTPAGSFQGAEPLHSTDPVLGSVTTDGSPPAADAPGGDLPAVPGYRVLHEIARGGMGCVLAAYDPTLDREVALKILLPGAAADRFVRESKITARLPHPGIPPVYALGTLADGSPFLAMKLIAGRTLADEMKSADRPRSLQAFTQVCQAVGFAHSRGIVHRDLKPANVMVGAFGEVQVMDWGLAKDLASQDVADQPPSPEGSPVPLTAADPGAIADHRPAGESTDARTQAGQVMGTPAYMAPEQARGEAADVRSDVFALGGILCAILTGEPPYRGKSTLEVIRRAGAADLADTHARLDACGAEAELVALCRACLSPNPADRPADGRAVADGMTAYLDGVQERLQDAQRERAVAVARDAEQHKRRKVQLALAATVLLAVLGGAAGAGIYLMQAEKVRSDAAVRAATEQGRLGRNGDEVGRLLDQAAEALRAGDPVRAKGLLDAAAKRADEGGADESSARRERLRADLAVLIKLDKIDQSRWITSPERTVVVAQFRKALAGFGLRPASVSAQEAAARVSGSAVRDRLVAALDHWLVVDQQPWVRAVLQGADPHPYRDAVRDALLARNRPKVVELASQRQAAEQPPGFVALLGDSVAMPVERRRELLTAAVWHRPNDLVLLMTLGINYPHFERAGAEERLRWFQAAVGVAPRNGAAHNLLGLALYDAGRKGDAITSLQKATKFAPDYSGIHINLGSALAETGRHDEAIVSFRKAIRLKPESAEAHANLGNALAQKGRYDEAIVSFQKAIAIVRSRKDPDLERKFAYAHLNLGNALSIRRRYDEAIASYKKATAADPNHAKAHGGLGKALHDKGRLDEAIASYQKAIACFEKASKLDPMLAWVHANLGLALGTRGQVDEAIASCRKAVELDPKLSAAHNNLGFALMKKGQLDEATACWRKAIKLDPKNAIAHSNLGEALRREGKVAEAIASLEKAIKLEPKEAKHHYNLGLALEHKGRKDQAIASYKKAIDLDRNLSAAHNNLGLLLLVEGQLDEAIACFEKAVELEPKTAKAHAILGEALKRKGRVDEAIASFEKAIDLDPNLPIARHTLAILHFNNGNGYCNSGKRDEAIASYKKAIACFEKASKLDPMLADVHTDLGVILAGKGQLGAAIASFRKAVKVGPKNARAHQNLGTALVATGQVDEAIACFRKAIKLDSGNVGAHTALGGLLAHKGRMAESIASSRRAIELDPKNAEALCNLGRALGSQGQFAEALEALRRGHELGSKKPGWRYPSAAWVRQAEGLAALEARLPAFLKGEHKPRDTAERLGLAFVCAAKKLHHTATRLYAEAFAADPKLVEDLKFGHRYNAGCAAALAAAGQGKDAAMFDDKERARLRKQALDWLRADLTAWEKRLQSGKPADRTMTQYIMKHWQKDADAACIRDKAALEKLPADEQKAFTQLWADVAALLKKAAK